MTSGTRGEGDPDHSVIERPWEYDILRFCYEIDPDDWRDSFIDLTLRRDGRVRRLRFLGPQDLQIERGCFPMPTRGMQILDVRHRQLEGIGVRVADFEATRGAVTFWAREVIDLDAPPGLSPAG